MKPYLLTHLALGISVVGILGGCSESPPVDAASAGEPTEPEIRRVQETGQAVAAELMKRLGGQLKGALQTGGPVAAIAVCQQTALPLTEASGAAFEGVTIRRTTLKPRNPANAPDALDREVLDRFAGEAGLASVIEWEAETARYYQPLAIQEICLKCHGDPATFPEPLVKALAEAYPEDQAIGYELNDLRGVIRVDIARSDEDSH